MTNRLGIYREGDYVSARNARDLRRLKNYRAWNLVPLPDGRLFILRRMGRGA